MRIAVKAAVILLPLLAIACTDTGTTSMGRTRDAPPPLILTTQLLGANGEMMGTATVTQEPGGTRIAAAVTGVPAGDHAIHFHAVGKCDAPGFTTAGGHFNPAVKQHGSLNPMGEHGGDLPNITIGTDGRGDLTAMRPGLRLVDGPAPLLDADGAAVVLHAKPDDYRTDPAGNAGDRIACGVLAYGKPK